MELRQFFTKTLIVIGTLAGVYMVYELRSILLLFFGAILFASTVRPAVLYLKGHGVEPIFSILIIYLLFLAGVAAVVIILFPAVFASVQDLVKSQAAIFSSIDSAILGIQSLVSNGAGVSVPLPNANALQSQLSQLQKGIQSNFDVLILDGVAVVSEALILFVMAFYWLTERDRMEQLGARMLPLRHRERFVSLVNEIEGTLGAFVRGETILCGTVGLLAFVVLSLLGIRSALVLASFAAVTEAIPMIGPILGAIPALLVALTMSPEKALFVAGGYLIIQQLESQVLVPKVMERQVGLSPLFVLLALTAGNLLAGIAGAIVAIPIAAALKILFRDLVVEPTVEANKFPVLEGGAVLLTEAGAEAAAPEGETPPATPPETIEIATPTGGGK